MERVNLHKHWTVHGYENQEGNQLHGIVQITVLDAVTEKDALYRARRIIKKPFYRVMAVNECASCAYLKDVRKFMNKAGRELGGDDDEDE